MLSDEAVRYIIVPGTRKFTQKEMFLCCRMETIRIIIVHSPTSTKSPQQGKLHVVHFKKCCNGAAMSNGSSSSPRTSQPM